MSVLVTGGAGYVGSHLAGVLVRSGREVVVVDDLSTGDRERVPSGAVLCETDVGGPEVEGLLRTHGVETIFHAAGRIQVEESVREPWLYYRENLVKGAMLIAAAHAAGVRRIVFSSTAAVYGEPSAIPIPEDHRLAPLSPYGISKLAFEQVLARSGIPSVSLRYFNAAGLAEQHVPETHLIPNVLRAAGDGRPVDVFGADYPTRDGTCVRDYVHVLDLCEAHLAAEHYLAAGGASGAFNVGSGRGYSVMEVVATVADVTGLTVHIRERPRRSGDSAVLVADVTRARSVLGFEARRGLEEIVRDAWDHRHAVAASPAQFPG